MIATIAQVAGLVCAVIAGFLIAAWLGFFIAAAAFIAVGVSLER